MTQTIGHWLLFGLALLFANLPFLSQRIMGFFPVLRKGGWARVLELIAGYVIVGLIGFAIEGSLGQKTTQRWEFYALTACLFLVLAFPGFVYRFLWRSPKA